MNFEFSTYEYVFYFQEIKEIFLKLKYIVKINILNNFFLIYIYI